LITVCDVAELRAAVRRFREAGESVSLVPTMGALHEGHLSLVALGKAKADRLVASLFVNPKQFGNGEDYSRYPRQAAADAAMLEAAGCDILFAPTPDSVYPPGFGTSIHVAGLGDRFEGAERPGHFDGVATVVAKLLGMVAPDVALFGEKDWQQLAVVRRLVADLDLSVAILGGPIVRAADGLALSSRNAYLSADERARAPALAQTLRVCAEAIEAGAPVAETLAEGRAQLLAAGFQRVDYLALVDAATLEPLTALAGAARLIAAARMGSTRLLDNMAVGDGA
jgi:pantoate--beta-alanine ligase